MKSKQIALSAYFMLQTLLGQSQDMFISKFTAINPVCYTDVIYAGLKDTVLVAARNGRISKRINGVDKEFRIIKMDDEVYALARNPESREIAASTLENGIIVINEKTGKISAKLSLKSTWSDFFLYSANFKYLSAQDQNGNRYLWDVKKNYRPILLPDSFPKGKIVKIDENNTAVVLTAKKMVYCDVTSGKKLKEIDVELDGFADIDERGNLLSLNFNECSKYDVVLARTEFTVKHPSWPFPNPADEKQMVQIPLSMQLITAKFADSRIITAGIDRSIRVWDKQTGELVKTLTEHKATVNKIQVSSNQRQFVSIDLKGGIKFSAID